MCLCVTCTGPKSPVQIKLSELLQLLLSDCVSLSLWYIKGFTENSSQFSYGPFTPVSLSGDQIQVCAGPHLSVVEEE